MILIAHRGNTEGPNLLENKPEYILKTLESFDVEIDLWVSDGLYLGHDMPQYKINSEFLLKNGLWIHCKNIEALEFCKENCIENNYFYHQIDDVTLTSNGLLWTYPGKILTKWSIAVLPEMKKFEKINSAYGICTDYINNYEI